MSTNHPTHEHTEPRLALSAAIERAHQWRGPVRLVHDDGEAVAEIYVNRGCVIHAYVNGLSGLPAVAAIVGDTSLGFRIERDRWPRRCSMLAPWDALLREVERTRLRAQMPAPHIDDEPTTPLFEA